MKRLKNYTSIWNVERMIYALGDYNLPKPMSFTQIAWFVCTWLAVVCFGKVPPLSMIDNMIIKYLVIPGVVTWLMSQKTFDGKKPYSFLKSVVAYMIRPKETYAGKPIKIRTVTMDETITVVRSEVYEVEPVSDKIYRK